ncbi:MAG: nuclear transport factor 2 family protein [Deltaproteobacteria bacterium]|nr:nuclear transport factor 2 family protein [Deltaproteobacteria bacterium]
MDEREMTQWATEFLDAWNTQDVERVLDCYTDDVTYVDPNTKGPVLGRDAMRRYLTKLFAAWTMRWGFAGGAAVRRWNGLRDFMACVAASGGNGRKRRGNGGRHGSRRGARPAAFAQ